MKCSGCKVVWYCSGCKAVWYCSGCKAVWHCGTECQKKDWKERDENKHKLQCPRIKEQRDLYKERRKAEVKEEAVEILERARITETFEQLLEKE